MMNIENRVFEISALRNYEGINVQNLVYEISELKFKSMHPEEEGEN